MPTPPSAGKGLLAAEESTGTLDQRFEAIGLKTSEANRSAYRSLLASCDGLAQTLSGVILVEETLFQDSSGAARTTPAPHPRHRPDARTSVTQELTAAASQTAPRAAAELTAAVAAGEPALIVGGAAIRDAITQIDRLGLGDQGGLVEPGATASVQAWPNIKQNQQAIETPFQLHHRCGPIALCHAPPQVPVDPGGRGNNGVPDPRGEPWGWKVTTRADTL